MEWSLIGGLSVFFIGLGLNLTPCVYPMLSVTVALFSAEQKRKLHESFLRAAVYVLGMALIYSVLGVTAAYTGRFFGSAAQSPFLLIVFSVLMFALALSMFGAYEFQVPSWILARIGGRRRAGFLGLFISGILVGVFAAPCIGPPIVALLVYVGGQSDPVSGFFIFFILSLGLGSPYLILGTFSGLLAKLPKSGDWLIWIKKAFGFLLLGLSVNYLCLATYPGMGKFLFPVLSVFAAVYLGFFERAGEKAKSFRKFKRAFGVLVVLVTLAGAFFGMRPKVQWEAYQAGRLESAIQAHQPVVIDFYASWCISCHELEQFTYSDPQVIKALEPFVRVKVDLTDQGSPETQALIERFEIVGVPTVIFLDPNGKEVRDSRIEGFAPADEFLKVFESVLERNLNNSMKR